jgi:hypothetical protein
LGQILTYAAGLKAVTLVWIAERFTEEHRATLDWLNEITGDNISFFGIEIELWQIGNSAVAPKFNLVAKPNDWTKGGGRTARAEDITPVKALQLEYWTALREFLIEQKSFIQPQKPLPQHWTNFSIGRSGFHLVAIANTRDKCIMVYLCLSGPNAKAYFRLLKEQREGIEKELGADLEWVELPGKKESRIERCRAATDPSVRQEWPAQHRWIQKQLEAFHRVFSGRVKRLRSGESISAQASDQ